MPVNLGLGSPVEAVRRWTAMFGELADPATGRAQVPLAELGIALTAPLGDVFDEVDSDDRAVLAEVVRDLGPAMAATGWVVAALPAEPPRTQLVSVRQVVTRGVLPRTGWTDLLVDVRRATRWRRRARAEDAGRGSKQPLPSFSAPPPTVPVVAVHTATMGCIANVAGRLWAGVPCVPAPAGRLVCGQCGAVTLLGEPIPGPRLLICECSDEPVCAHPRALSRPRVPPRGQPVSRDQLRAKRGQSTGRRASPVAARPAPR